MYLFFVGWSMVQVNFVDEVYKILAGRLGVSVDYLKQSTYVKSGVGGQVSIIHPSLVDEKYPVITKLLFTPSTFANLNAGLLLRYADLLKHVSPHFVNVEESVLKGVLKNGLNVVLNYDNSGSVSLLDKVLINYWKSSGIMSHGYVLSFNPDLVKYYRSDTKEVLSKGVIKPFVGMFVDMVFLHSMMFLMGKERKVDTLKNLIVTLFEASFNKKKFESVMSVGRDVGKPVVVVLERWMSKDGGRIRMVVKNINRLKYMENVYKPNEEGILLFTF